MGRLNRLSYGRNPYDAYRQDVEYAERDFQRGFREGIKGRTLKRAPWIFRVIWNLLACFGLFVLVAGWSEWIAIFGF